MDNLCRSITHDEIWELVRAEWQLEAERVLRSVWNGSANMIIATGPCGIGKTCLLTPNIIALCDKHGHLVVELLDGVWLDQCRGIRNVTRLFDMSMDYVRHGSANFSMIMLDEALELIGYPIKKNHWVAKHCMSVFKERRLTPILIAPSQRQWFRTEATGIWRGIASDYGYNANVIELEKRSVSSELATRIFNTFEVDDKLIAFIGDPDHDALRTPTIFSFLLNKLHQKSLRNVADLKAMLQDRRGSMTFWEDMIENAWGISLQHMLRVVRDIGIPTQHPDRYRLYD